jgi:hypothetical protein
MKRCNLSQVKQAGITCKFAEVKDGTDSAACKSVTSRCKLNFIVSYCGIISAISVMLMFLSIIPSFSYAFPAVAGLAVWTVKPQVSAKWGMLCFLSVSFLSAIIVPNFEAVVFFVLIFGYYPILRETFGDVKIPFLRMAAKLLYFNAIAVAGFQIMSVIAGAKAMLEGMEFFGKYAVYVLWIMANIAFLSYDLCVSQFYLLYYKIIRPKISTINH